MAKPQSTVCYCTLCRPSLCDGTIDVHVVCCSDEHCPARHVSDEAFLRTFTDEPDLKGTAFSFTATLVGEHVGFAMMQGIANGIATINADGHVRTLGYLASQTDH